MQLESHHWSLTADETAWHFCTTGAEKLSAEHTRKATAKLHAFIFAGGTPTRRVGRK